MLNIIGKPYLTYSVSSLGSSKTTVLIKLSAMQNITVKVVLKQTKLLPSFKCGMYLAQNHRRQKNTNQSKSKSSSNYSLDLDYVLWVILKLIIIILFSRKFYSRIRI